MSNKPRGLIVFRLIIISSVLFFLTVLGMIAGALAPSESPLAQLFDRYAIRLMGYEVAAILACVALAMFVDRPRSSDSDSSQNTNLDAFKKD